MDRRFLLDGMLGSLARWLRIGGYDTEYLKDTPDDDLIEEARRSERILLTRDEVLAIRAKKRGVEAVLLKGEADEDALAELASALHLTFDPTQARCPKCNHTVDKVEKAVVVGKVPEGTYKVIEDYWLCPSCGGVYWRGSHWPRIVETLSHANHA
jgi:uncharacterized protein with PIN domain